MTDGDAGYDDQLAGARDEALGLGWDLIETPGGIAAVPRGTQIIASPAAGVLMTTLRAHLPVTAPGDEGSPRPFS
jgi:hypothetical protein